MTKQYLQDSVSTEQARCMAMQALGDIGHMHRCNSENNQVYHFHDSAHRLWVIKIAGKEDYQRQGLLTEITCLRQLRSLGLPVPDIHYTHKDIHEPFQPFFIMPYLGESIQSQKYEPECLTKLMEESGRFVKLLSEIKGECFNGDVLMDKETTLDYFNAECRDNTSYLKANGLWDDSVEKCLAWVTDMYRHHPLCVGQSQASEPLMDRDGNIRFIDFEGGLNYTFPLKSLSCIPHYIEDRSAYDIAKTALLNGFFENAPPKALNAFDREWAHWRQYKALTDLVFLSVTRDDPSIFRSNWNRYDITE